MSKFNDINSDNVEKRAIEEVMKYIGMYEEAYSHYHFYNWELAELERLDGRIDEEIKPLLDNEEVLLSMIKDKWRVMDHVNLQERNPEFIYKAWMLNPKSILRGMNFIKDMESFIKTHDFSKEVIKEIERQGRRLQETEREFKQYYPKNYENEFIRFIKLYNDIQLQKTQEQQKQSVFYSLDGQTYPTIDEALMRNQEIEKEMSNGMKL